jgi:hypothetical protein
MLDMLEDKHPGIMFTIFNSIERIRPALEVMAREEGLRECSECGEHRRKSHAFGPGRARREATAGEQGRG